MGVDTSGGVMQGAGRSQALTLIALGTLPTMAIAALVPVLPLLFQHFATVPHRELLVPMVLTVPSLCVALFSAPIGAAADRWGRRPVLILALAAFTISGALPMLFDDLYAIIGSRAIVGVAEAAILTIGNALMGDYFADERRKYWLGIQMSLGPFVASGYILLGGVLGSWSWRGPFLIYLLGAVVLLAASITLFEPLRASTAAGPSSLARRFPWRPTWLIGCVTILVAIVFFLQNVQHGRIFADLGVSSPARISAVVTIASGGTVLGGYFFKIARPWPVGRMLALAFVCYGISYIGIALSPNYLIGMGFDALGQFAGGYVLPTLIAWALSKYAFEHRGRGMGIWGGCFFVGQFLSPPVMTLIAHGRLSFLASTGVLGALCLVAAAACAVTGARGPALAVSGPSEGPSG